jgi:23S rRNA-/tRNA-specific pseudouridylate synthase
MSDPPAKDRDGSRDGEREVPGDLAGRPLDGAVRTLFGVSWGEARKWIASGKVRVDGEPVTDALKYVQKGSRVLVTMSAPKRAKGGRGGERVVLDDAAIIHLDAHVIVVNKPSGVSTIPYEGANEVLRAAGSKRIARGESETLDELVRAWLSKRVKRGERDTRPQLGVVHRLDKETSGVLVFTRSWLGKQSLAAQFRAHTVHRRYLAIAHGVVQPGTIRSQLVADRGRRARRRDVDRVSPGDGAHAPDSRAPQRGGPSDRRRARLRSRLRAATDPGTAPDASRCRAWLRASGDERGGAVRTAPARGLR